MKPFESTLICRGKILDLSIPVVMGILNATPNSFYTGHLDFSEQQWIDVAGQMVVDGATLLDVGGMSSKPGAEFVSMQEELDRILPVITALIKHVPEPLISVDTFRSEVAKEALECGIHIINDISGGELDNDLPTVVQQHGAAYICMHMQGIPETMQHAPTYSHVVNEIADYFKDKINHFTAIGLDNVILDPGFGFGKTIAHNYELLAQLNSFHRFGKPLLVGLSRKSMICKPLNISPKSALNGTTALHMAALQQGTNILRVHDVKEAKECILLHQYLQHKLP